MLLPVAAKPWRGRSVGSYVGRQAQTPAIRSPFVGSSGSAAMQIDMAGGTSRSIGFVEVRPSR